MLEIYKFTAFTTPCEIQLYCDDKIIANSCASDILKECKRLEKKYNFYDENSYLNSINKRETTILDGETKTLLSGAKQYYKKTSNIFDITIATMKKNKALISYVGCEHFNIKKDKINFDNNYTIIDLGGYVKEYSVDRAVKIVKKYKIKSALINFGGDIYAIGTKPNKQKFSIGITNPKDKDKKLFSIDIQDQALTTSALYERDGHILSKNNNNDDILSVTVVSNSCINSGVYTTALMCDKNLKIHYDKYLIDKNLKVLR